MQSEEGILTLGLSKAGGFLLLLFWLVTLITAVVLRSVTSYSNHFVQPLHWFEAFYWIGSSIYGGGQVVLPMLLSELVQEDCYVDDHGKQVGGATIQCA
jgi:chromate transporter